MLVNEDKIMIYSKDNVGDIFVFSHNNRLWFSLLDVLYLYGINDNKARERYIFDNIVSKGHKGYIDIQRYENSRINKEPFIDEYGVKQIINYQRKKLGLVEDFIMEIINDYDKSNINNNSSTKFAFDMLESKLTDDEAKFWFGKIKEQEPIYEILKSEKHYSEKTPYVIDRDLQKDIGIILESNNILDMDDDTWERFFY